MHPPSRKPTYVTLCTLLILILNMLLLPAAPVLADDPLVFNAVEDCSCLLMEGAPSDHKTSPGHLSCMWEGNVDGLFNVGFWLQQYADAGAARTKFKTENAERYATTKRIASLTSGRDILVEANPDADLVYEWVFRDTRSGNVSYSGTRSVLYNEFIIHIGPASTDQGQNAVQERMDALQACAEAAITKRLALAQAAQEEKLNITLEHYHPFNEEIPGNLAGGDILATVKEDGKPAQGKLVFFFRNLEYPGYNPDFFKMPLEPTDFGDEHRFFGLSGDYAVAATNALGQATFNYMENGCINYPGLAKKLEEHGGIFKVAITAAVFDRDPRVASGDKPKIEAMRDIDIVFKGLARIVMVRSTDPREAEGKAVVQRAGAGDVTVTNDMLKNVDTEAGYRGFNLLPGDRIVLSQYDTVDVQWLAGTYTIFKPNGNYLGEDGGVRAEIEIGSSDAGWFPWLDKWVNHPYLGASATIAGAAVGIYGWKIATAATWTTPVGVFTAIPGVVALVWSAGAKYAYPVVMEHKSQILLDFDGEQVTVYTVEGSATLYDIETGEPMEVAAGQARAVAEDGTIGPASPFERAELSENLSDLLDTVQEGSASLEAPPEDQPGEADRPAEDGSSSLVTGYATLGCVCFGVVGLVLFVIVFLVRRRKKRREPSPGEDEVAAPAETTAPPPAAPAPEVVETPDPTPEPAPTPRFRFCPNCGARTQSGAAFCVECGARISGPQE
jgi:hypothetical protein